MFSRPFISKLFRFLQPSNSKNRSLSIAQNAVHQVPRASQSPKRVIFSGIQPTGVPHLGNYLGALRPWVQFQKEEPSSTRIFYMIADLHAENSSQDIGRIKEGKRQTLAALLAVGLDPNRCTIFVQSEV